MNRLTRETDYTMCTNSCFSSPCTAEWQVMCEFKALQTVSEDQGRGEEGETEMGSLAQEHRAVCLKEFYTFYEVQNLRWTQVRKDGILKLGREEGSVGKAVDRRRNKNSYLIVRLLKKERISYGFITSLQGLNFF